MRFHASQEKDGDVFLILNGSPSISNGRMMYDVGYAWRAGWRRVVKYCVGMDTRQVSDTRKTKMEMEMQ
jgi:hypothetical protein